MKFGSGAETSYLIRNYDESRVMSSSEKALNTPQAYQAIGKGVVTLIFKKDLNIAVDAMLVEAKKNGSLPAVQAAVVVDAIEAIAKVFGFIK